MTNTYDVLGMTCSGCANGVRTLLSTLDGVKDVSVDLPKQEAVIDSKYHVSILVLQDALVGTTYLIAEQGSQRKLF